MLEPSLIVDGLSAFGGGASIEFVDDVAPIITSSNTASWLEGFPWSRNLTANETVSWFITGGADAALFDLDGNVLSLPSQDFDDPADAGANNTYVVQITAVDLSANATDQTITVTIMEDGTGDYEPSLDFSDDRNSMYLALI